MSATGYAAKTLEFDHGRQDKAFVQGIDNTYTVPAYVSRVEALTTAANNAFTVTLPRPEEVPGKIIEIFMTARNATDDITVTGIGFSNIVLNAANEYTRLHSDGIKWSEIGLNHT